jgi:hypothetical protein
MNEQEIQEVISKLITIRNTILNLKDRQSIITTTTNNLNTEYIENADKIIDLGQEGKKLIRQLVLND